MDQLALAFTPPDIGLNQPSEAIDAIENLKARLIAAHADLLTRFRDLELACARVPDPILTEKDAATATDFIAQCQLHLKCAEAARTTEKVPFLRGGRAVGTFFKARCERLGTALAPLAARLITNRARVATAERRLADEAAERAEATRQMASAPLELIRIRANYGATAFVRRAWSFEVVDLDQIAREYMNLDVHVVREAITQDRIRNIPGLKIFQAEGSRVRATTSPRNHKAPSQREQAVETSKSADAATHQSSDQRSSGPRTPKRRGRIRSLSDPRLVASIKPIWGDQRVLRYYRQALASLQPHDAAEIAKCRAANAVIEAPLWWKLPHCMEEIKFLYGGSRVSPEAGEGTPK